jgi:hypothetical protein
MLLNRELIRSDNDLYITIRKIPNRDGMDTDKMKEFLSADKVLNKNGDVYFCQLIEEIEIVS